MPSGVLKMKMPEIDERLSDDEIRDAIWSSIIAQIPILVKQMAADGIQPCSAHTEKAQGSNPKRRFVSRHCKAL
jgi:hypothetical protein